MTMLSRRAVLSLAGTTFASGLVATAAARQTRPRGRVIRTLGGDLDPAAISGAVLFHEHLSMRFPLDASAHFTDDVALMVAEARAARSDGVGLIVDGGHPDMHRRLDALSRITTESGLPLVASGGYYMQRSYPPELETMPAERIADLLVREAARDRLGAFGEIGQQGGLLTATETTVLQAVALASVRTGLPVFTHNPYLGVRPGAADIPPEAALRQLDILEKAGAAPGSLAIGHVCCLHAP
ncbi:MAG: hypothetical protein R2708_29480, partial [Vicinamibacterales bacterium]